MHPMPFRLSMAALAAGLALGTPLAAQAQSLKELYEAARAYDATYLAAKSFADSADFKAEQARAAWRPSVNLSSSATRSTADTPYSSTLSTDTTSVQAALSGQQTLYNAATNPTIAQAERGVDVARSQLRAAEQDLIVRLSQAYFDMLASADALGTVLASKTAIAEQLASAKRNFEVGTATITDTREAQARYDLALAQEVAAENDLRVKRLALEQLVGRTGVKPHPLGPAQALPALLPAEVEPWVGAADTTNPSIEQARLAYEVAKLETEKARAAQGPTVALTGSYAKSHISVGGNAAVQNQIVPYSGSGNGTNASIGVTLTMPLFAGYSIQNRIRETLALEDKARNDLEGARRSVAQGTRTAFFGVQSGLSQVKALEAAEQSSKLSLEATQLGYKVGVRVNLDVLNAQTQLYTTQRDLAKARYDVLVGSLKLRQATGQLVPADIDAIDPLLVR